jgi:hypothetical protein
LQGDARALDRVVELAQRFNNDAGEIGLAQPLCADDQAILAAYAAEIAAASKPPTAVESPDEPTPNPAASSDGKAAK